MDTKLRDGIDWVGYVDWTVRDFHSYVTSRGATYNSYLVQDEKIAIIDAVKAPYAEYLLKNVSAKVPLDKVDYLVVNHAEPDHAGSVPAVVAACPNAVVVCDEKCKATLGSYHDISGWNFQIVKTGDTLSLGKRTLTFLETPMVHWPESMFTYIPEEKLLFSMDAFGQHFASNKRFDDEVDMCAVMEEAKKYYANIVMLYGKQISKVLDAAAGLDIEMIAPSHGVIWRKNIGTIVEAYKNWVVCKAEPKVLVIYDSMWESTKKMGEAIIAGATEEGVEAKLIYVRATGLTDIATEVLDAATIAFGSATLNQSMMPMMAATLTYIKGLKPTGKAGFAFGSSGWGKGGAEEIDEFLKGTSIEVLREPIKAKWRPVPEVVEELKEAGRLLARKAKEICSL
ncbi:MAG: MBL fold metallo-hydrolase [Planctomycetes bacterium]|nr:MBL fold metallo-hydrolase [Planctomycetota bacterium]